MLETVENKLESYLEKYKKITISHADFYKKLREDYFKTHRCENIIVEVMIDPYLTEYEETICISLDFIYGGDESLEIIDLNFPSILYINSDYPNCNVNFDENLGEEEDYHFRGMGIEKFVDVLLVNGTVDYGIDFEYAFKEVVCDSFYLSAFYECEILPFENIVCGILDIGFNDIKSIDIDKLFVYEIDATRNCNLYFELGNYVYDDIEEVYYCNDNSIIITEPQLTYLKNKLRLNKLKQLMK